MKFETFVLKASGGFLGGRQLVDVPVGAKFRFAELTQDEYGNADGIEITYSVCREGWVGSRVVPKAFVVIDPTRMSFGDLAEFEDNGGIDPCGRGDDRPEDVKILRHVITAGTVIVYEAV